MPRMSLNPSVVRTAFDCPHCGAFTSHTWHVLHAASIDDGSRCPYIPVYDEQEELLRSQELNEKSRNILRKHFLKLNSRRPFFDDPDDTAEIQKSLHNVHVGECYNCGNISLWVHECLVYPGARKGPEPNSDLPEVIRGHFEEARAIVDQSPRGAAALLRLCVQLLGAHLGEKGRNIDEDIASLVGKGLDPLVQQALDIVRVIGNEAVHPGTIDLNDNRETALKLFDLVNAIAEQMITHPESIKKLYGSLPESKRKAIEGRNAKAVGKPSAP